MHKLIYWIMIVSLLFILGCSQEAQQMAPPATPSIPADNANNAANQPEKQAPAACVSTLQPHQITKVTFSFDNGLEKSEEGFTIRVVPTNDKGDIVPANGTTTITVFSSREDMPRQSDYRLYSRSFHVKDLELMADCRPRPITVLWNDIRQSDKYRYLNLPNYGIIRVEYTRTGSPQIWEENYIGADHNDHLLN